MELLIVLAGIVAVSTILYGVRVLKTQKVGRIQGAVVKSVTLFSMALVAFVMMGILEVPVFATGAEAATQAAASGMSLGEGFKYLAAALSTGLATIGTGLAVGSVGSSAIGAVSEDPSILGKTLIFVGMAEGIAIYGMIISILILFV
jgi:V/A-type H+-transporting ATPase subunit K